MTQEYKKTNWEQESYGSEAMKSVSAPSEPIDNAKGREADDWLNQLVSLINGEISHYMSQGMDYFSVDYGPWHIKYDNTKGESNE